MTTVSHGDRCLGLAHIPVPTTFDFYSFDNTSHNGGVFKVFKQEGGKLKRIGTADENLNIFKK